MISRRILWGCLGLLALANAAGFLSNQQWIWAGAGAAIILLWALAILRKSAAISSLLFVVSVLFCAVAYLLGGSPFLALAGVGLALAAWDLDRFSQRLEVRLAASRQFTPPPGEGKDPEPATTGTISIRQVEMTHLRRLGMALLGGWLLGATALAVRLHFSFVLMLMLAFLAFITLRLALGSIRGYVSTIPRQGEGYDSRDTSEDAAGDRPRE